MIMYIKNCKWCYINLIVDSIIKRESNTSNETEIN